MESKHDLHKALLRSLRAALLPSVLALAACGGGEPRDGTPPGAGQAEHAASQTDPAPFPNPVARARLIAAHPYAAPGEEVLLGVTFDVTEGWHLYWKGRNDTGLSPRVRLEAPPGYVAGDLRWPAPKRKISPGRILDHVYEGPVTLLLPVTVPADAAPGSVARFRASVEWMACREACIPESSTVALDLPVAVAEEEALAIRERADGTGDGAAWPPADARPQWGERIAAARAALPAPLPADLPGLKRAWSGSTLVISLDGAEELFFYPSLECAELEDLIRDGAAAGDALRLAFRGTAETIRRVSGVLEVRSPGVPPRFFAVDLPGPGA